VEFPIRGCTLAHLLLILVSSLKRTQLIIDVGYRFASVLQPLLACSVFLTLQGMDFNLKLKFLALQFVNGLWSRFARDTDTRSC
jgi:hypothetical protein